MSDPVDKHMPKKIWLQPHMYPKITWCADQIEETDVEYVRRDVCQECIVGGEIKWYIFDESRGSRQKRPPIKKYVLVEIEHPDKTYPNPIVVAYMKNAAGDKQSPYFVTPGVTLAAFGKSRINKIIRWCDCLPEGFEYPKPEEAHDE